MIIQHHPLENFFEKQDRHRHMDGETNTEIQLKPFLAHINLRSCPEDAGFLESVKQVFKKKLPQNPNVADLTGDQLVCCLGPDEWLIIAAAESEQELMMQLQDSLGKQHHAITSLTGGQVVLHLSGTDATRILAKGCNIDLHSSVFPVGQCAQTLLAKANALIIKVDDKPSFDIVVRRSFAEYVALWLHKAADEYGVKFTHIGMND